MRYLSITSYAKYAGISREAVYKRIKAGTAILLADCDVPVIDTELSRGKIERNDWSGLKGKKVYKLNRKREVVVTSGY